MPVIQLVSRETSSPALNPIYIAGFVLIAVMVLSLIVWLLIRVYRRRAAAKRESQLGSAFLSVRGIVGEEPREKHENPSIQIHNGFSRAGLTPSIILPDRAHIDDVAIDGKMESDLIDSLLPFPPKPFALALGSGSSNQPMLGRPISTSTRSSWIRQSFLSSTTRSNRFSILSATSSIRSQLTTGTMRKIRQLFSPVLPDELVLSGLGEQLTVLQSFDDGWCLVGREDSIFATPAVSLFKSTQIPEQKVELGVVPAWCFLKPVQGLRAERPVRSSSLGITVQMEGHGFSSRDELVSWSNF